MSDQRELDEALAMLHQRARTANPPMDALRERVLAEANDNVVPLRSARKGRWLLPVAAAAVVIAGVTAVQVTKDAPDQAQPAAPAADLLNGAADRNVDGTPGPGGAYLHVVQRGTVPQTVVYGTVAADDVVDSPPNSGFTIARERHRESWVPFDPRAQWQEERRNYGPPRLIGGGAPEPTYAHWTDEGKWTAPCGNYFPLERPKTICGGPNDPASPTFFADAPTAPVDLLNWLRKHSPSTDDSAVFAKGVEFLSSGVLPKGRYADWYRALALIPGATDLGDVTLPDGRIGAAIGVVGARERRELVINRADGRFLGERRVAGERPAQPWIPPGTVLGLLSVSSTTVPALGDR